MLGIEPVPAGWEAQMLPLCYADSHFTTLLFPLVLVLLLRDALSKSDSYCTSTIEGALIIYCPQSTHFLAAAISEPMPAALGELKRSLIQLHQG